MLHFSFRCVEMNANIRIRLIVFIVQMGDFCMQEIPLSTDFRKFISTFSEHLLIQVN